MASGVDTSSRDVRIDALKGFAILCVVAYHTMGQYWIVAPKVALYSREFLFSFMLPLFAFLSGFVVGRARDLKPREYFTRRTLGLMVPYLMWEAVYGVATVSSARMSISGFMAYVLRTLADPHYEGRMWYLYVLWIALILLGVVRVSGRDNGWVLAASLVLAFIWPWWGHFKRLQWIYGYVVLGVLARRAEGLLDARRRVWGLIGAAAFVPLWIATRPEQLAVARLTRWLGDSMWAGGGVSALYGLSTVAGVAAIAAITTASHGLPTRLTRMLALPGRLSLGIYVVHFPFVEVWHEPPLMLVPVIIGVALAASVAITLLLARWRVTALLFLGERWSPKSLPLGDVRTETL